VHRGNLYPYHPSYWATECYFWPSWVPWKIFVEVGGGAFLPSSQLAPGWSGPSEAGDADADIKVPTWEIVIPRVSGPDVQLIVSSFKIELDGPKVGWALAFLDGGANDSTWAAAQPYPGMVFGLDYHEPKCVWPPAFEGHTLNISIRPATWAEGGSPWPD